MTTNVSWMNNTNRAAYWLGYDRLSDAYYVAAGVCMVIFIVLAVLGNVVTLLVFVRSRQQKFVSNWFLMSMAVADLLASSLCYPLVAIASFSGHWPFGRIGCYTYCIVVGTCNFAAISSMVLVAVDRSLVIRRCTGNQSLGKRVIGSSFNRKMALVAIIVVWMYSASLVMPPIFGWGNYILDAMEVSCTFDYVSDDPSVPYFVLTLFGCGFSLPFMVIVVCYVYIFSRLYNHRRTNLSFLRTHTKTSLSSRVSDVRMAKVGATVVAMFVVAWLPYGILAMVGAFGRVQISPQFQIIAELFAKSSAMYNPIIYSMSHPDFRRKVRYIVGRSSVLSVIVCCMCCHKKVIHETTSQEEMELEISMNVNVRQTRSQRDRGNNRSVNTNLTVCDLEVKQTMTILKSVPERPIFLEQVMIQHSPNAMN